MAICPRIESQVAYLNIINIMLNLMITNKMIILIELNIIIKQLGKKVKINIDLPKIPPLALFRHLSTIEMKCSNLINRSLKKENLNSQRNILRTLLSRNINRWQIFRSGPLRQKL